MNLNIILKRIKPNKKEKAALEKFSNKLVKKFEKITKRAKPLICGSAAKDTWLSKRKELDLFLLFDPNISRKQLERDGLKLAKKLVKAFNGKYQIAFAEHPYLRGWIKGYEVDIVPAYSIENPEKIKSAVDRTPHHVKFVKEKLKNPDEVRLLKQFCIANKCYGADIKTQGLSGYLCELLIIKYGSFMNCVKRTSKWRAGQVIVFISFDKDFILKKFKDTLIVIDPVDKNRNVGAAVSAESFYKFVKASKDFVEKPSKSFFFPQKTKSYSSAKIIKEIKKRGTKWYLIRFKSPKILEDVLYSQMRRCAKAIENLLIENGFRILRKGFYCNKNCNLVFEMEIWQIPRISKNVGPNIFSKHAEEFLKHYKNKKVFIEGENWVVETERKFTTILHFLKNLFKKSKKGLLKKGIPSKIAPAIKNCKIYSGGNFLKQIKNSSKDFRIFLKEWFEKDLF